MQISRRCAHSSSASPWPEPCAGKDAPNRLWTAQALHPGAAPTHWHDRARNRPQHRCLPAWRTLTTTNRKKDEMQGRLALVVCNLKVAKLGTYMLLSIVVYIGIYISILNTLGPSNPNTALPALHLPPRVRTDPVLSTAIAFVRSFVRSFVGGFASHGMVLCAKKNVGADGTEEKVFV